MGNGNQFAPFTNKPRGPNGGNQINLEGTPEGDKVLQTMRELGHATLGSPAVASTYEHDFVTPAANQSTQKLISSGQEHKL